MDKIVFYWDARGELRWHRKSENGRLVSNSGEGYRDPQDCIDMAHVVNGEDVIYMPLLPKTNPFDVDDGSGGQLG